MKRKGPTLGNVQVAYPLAKVFKQACKEYREADAAVAKVEQQSKVANKALNPLADVFTLKQRQMEIGVVLLISAGAYLEQTINDYALTFIDGNWYEEHLDNLRTVTKWIILPRLCQNKDISENDPAIIAFRELVRARNAIVHHKRRELDSHAVSSSNKTAAESARFWAVCKHVESTVDNLIKLLTSPPPKPDGK